MTDPKHHAGGHFSVWADEHGKPCCGTCGEPVTESEIFALLRSPDESTFMALCRTCTRRLAQLAMHGMGSEDSPIGVPPI